MCLYVYLLLQCVPRCTPALSCGSQVLLSFYGPFLPMRIPRLYAASPLIFHRPPQAPENPESLRCRSNFVGGGRAFRKFGALPSGGVALEKYIFSLIPRSKNRAYEATPGSANGPRQKKSSWGLYTTKRGKQLPCVFSLQPSWGLLLPSEERREVHKTK